MLVFTCDIYSAFTQGIDNVIGFTDLSFVGSLWFVTAVSLVIGTIYAGQIFEMCVHLFAVSGNRIPEETCNQYTENVGQSLRATSNKLVHTPVDLI